MKHGYRIPEDVSVVSFDGIPFSERITPSLSTISQPVEYQAKSIINGMLYLQDGVERPCDEKENEYLLQIRDSVGIPGHYEKQEEKYESEKLIAAGIAASMSLLTLVGCGTAGNAGNSGGDTAKEDTVKEDTAKRGRRL